MTGLSLELAWEGRRVRILGTEDDPLWVAKDVCRVLGIHASTANLSRDVPLSERCDISLMTQRGQRQCACLREGGVYRLIARSRKPEARRFQEWLFGEVLPCIRKHGCYPAPTQPRDLVDLDDIDTVRGLLEQFAARRVEDARVIAEMTPKAEAHDRFLDGRGEVSLQQAGRILGRKPNKLIALMEHEGTLGRDGHNRLIPNHYAREMGYFTIRVKTIPGAGPGGTGLNVPQTLVTPKGLDWLAKRYAATDRPGSTAIEPKQSSFLGH